MLGGLAILHVAFLSQSISFVLLLRKEKIGIFYFVCKEISI